MKDINEYVTKDIITNSRDLVEIYNILDQQLKLWGKVEVRIVIKEWVDNETE
jgi:hypothetical protein